MAEKTDEPSITIGEEKFVIQPLGVAAMAPLARIAMEAGKRGDVKTSELILSDDEGKPLLGPGGKPQPHMENIGRFLVAAVGYCEEDILILLSQLIAVPVRELHDAKRFSLTAIALLIGALVGSIDVTAFLPGGQLGAPVGEQGAKAQEGTRSPSPE